ncbi:hypothetical protein BGZ81_001557, partial [Podila clonocystis]
MGKKVIDLEPETPFHTFTVEQTAQHYNTSILEGLSAEEAANRLKSYGANELEGNGGVKWYKVLWRQVANALVVILLIATALAFATRDFAEGGVILFIIIMNAAIGFWQEFNAEQTMEALRNMSSPTAQVIRDETRVTIPNNQAVPGDIMIFEDGDVIGADCRLFEVFNLETDEALLTGESLPVQKNLEHIESADEALGDRLNMVFSSTTVVKGRAKGIVTNTGMKTQIGKIATTLMNVDTNEATPLQKRLNKMAYFVFAAALVLVLIVFAVHSFEYSNEVAIYAISVSIAIIPEGLVAVVTLTMAFGVRRMAEMVEGEFDGQENQISKGSGPDHYLRTLQVASLCNMSELRRTQHPESHGEWTAIGDPTEIALQVLAYKAGLPKPELVQQGFDLVAEFPFDSSVKRMSVLYKTPATASKTGEHLIFMKGATERVFPCCNYYLKDGQEVSLQSEKGGDRAAFEETMTEKMNALAEKGLRVLTLAYRKFEVVP